MIDVTEFQPRDRANISALIAMINSQICTPHLPHVGSYLRSFQSVVAKLKADEEEQLRRKALKTVSPDMSDTDWEQYYRDRDDRLARSFIKPPEDPEAAQEALLQEMSSSVLDAALNSSPGTALRADVKAGRGGMDISNAEILKLAQLPLVVRAETYKKWHKDDKCQRDGCGKLIGNHSLKKFKAHHHIGIFGEKLEAQAQVLSYEFKPRYNASDIDAHRGLYLDDCKLATLSINGRITTFRLTVGFRRAIYERDDNNVFWFMRETTDEELEARDSSVY